MTNIVIKRCPLSQSIDNRVREIDTALRLSLGLNVRIEDGVKDELSILVDGVPVLQRSTNYLPTVEEVEAAMQNAEPADRGVSSTGTVHHTDSWQSRPVDE